MPEIRVATEEDIEPLVLRLGGHMDEDRKTAFLDKVERYVRKPDRTLFVAKDDASRIVGFGCVIEKADVPETLSPRVAERLRAFALTAGLLVHPEHRKQGIGTALFRSIEQWVLDRGTPGNWLVTHRMGYWYRRDFGYEEVGRILKNGVEKMIMAREFENIR